MSRAKRTHQWRLAIRSPDSEQPGPPFLSKKISFMHARRCQTAVTLGHPRMHKQCTGRLLRSGKLARAVQKSRERAEDVVV